MARPKVTQGPNIESAAVTSRVISRRLRKAGLLMADTRDRYAWTEGVHVHRVGYGRMVSIDYHIPGYSSDDRRKRVEVHDRIKALLESWGYEVKTPGIYVECKGE